MTPTQRAAMEQTILDLEYISAAGGRVEFVERRIAALRAALAEQAPPANVPMLSDEELKDAIRHLYKDETALQMSIDITLHEFRAIEKLVRQKAGLK